MKTEYTLICSQMEQKGYQKKSYCFSNLKSNLLGLFFSLPFVVLLWCYYGFYYYGSSVIQPKGNLWEFLFFLVLFAISIFLHESVQGIALSILGKKKSVHFLFDVIIPRCYYDSLLIGKKYQIGILVPFFILGIGSSLFACLFPSMWALVFATANIVISGIDFLIACAIQFHKNAWVIDDPEKLGVTVFVKKR